MRCVVRMEVHTFDIETAKALLGGDQLIEGEEVRFSEDAILRFERTYVRKVRHFPQIFHFQVELATDSDAGKIADWILSHVQGRSLEKIVLEYREVTLEGPALKKALSGMVRTSGPGL